MRGAGDGFIIMALLYLIINLLKSEFSMVIVHPVLTGSALLWERGQHLREDVLRILGDDGIYLLIQHNLQHDGRVVHVIVLVGRILLQPHPDPPPAMAALTISMAWCCCSAERDRSAIARAGTACAR